jgi:hypothetical protein
MVCKDLGFSTNTTVSSELTEITKKVRDYTLGAALILGADTERYSSMIRGLKKASLAGRDEWPKNVTEAYNYLSKWEGDDSNTRGSRYYEGVAFTNNAIPSTEPQAWHAKMTCRNCNKVGHIASFCENNKKTATANTQDTLDSPRSRGNGAYQGVATATETDIFIFYTIVLCGEGEGEGYESGL